MATAIDPPKTPNLRFQVHFEHILHPSSLVLAIVPKESFIPL